MEGGAEGESGEESGAVPLQLWDVEGFVEGVSTWSGLGWRRYGGSTVAMRQYKPEGQLTFGLQFQCFIQYRPQGQLEFAVRHGDVVVGHLMPA